MQFLSGTLCALSLSVGLMACVCCVLGHCVSRPLPLRVWGVAAVVLPPVVSGSVPQDYLEQKLLLPSRLMQLLLVAVVVWGSSLLPPSCLFLPPTFSSFSIFTLYVPLSLFHSFSLCVCPRLWLYFCDSFFSRDDCMALIQRLLVHYASSLY